ncbi:TetR/AcrR family transcriptional regulator [Halomonas salifodinae]|uniref:TetR/AcrR family transcriptional regulator n=1 Tax=Halomonas salifodinae TaxID=438745 RepID=UPI00339E0BC6
MPWHPDHKAHSRERILRAAARLFTRHGFAGVSIDTLMQEAGLTRGAFYAHFASKSELYAEAIVEAARQGVERLGPSAPSAARARYLSREHLESETGLCPLASLVSDVAQQDPLVRESYTRLFQGFIDRIAGGGEEERQQSLQRAVMMIGGLAIARTLSDEALAEELLRACRQGIEADAGP